MKFSFRHARAVVALVLFWTAAAADIASVYRGRKLKKEKTDDRRFRCTDDNRLTHRLREQIFFITKSLSKLQNLLSAVWIVFEAVVVKPDQSFLTKKISSISR